MLNPPVTPACDGSPLPKGGMARTSRAEEAEADDGAAPLVAHAAP